MGTEKENGFLKRSHGYIDLSFEKNKISCNVHKQKKRLETYALKSLTTMLPCETRGDF